MGFPKTDDEWAMRSSAYLKAEMRNADVTYVELAKRLKKYGFVETEASITNKLKRGTFPATFFLASLAALGNKSLQLDEL